MAAEQPINTEEPSLAAAAMEGEEAASSARSSGSNDWQCVPGEAEASTTELAAFWQKKAEEQERLKVKAESEVIRFRNHWQQQLQEAETRKQEAKDEALMWQEKAAQQSALRAKAEAAATKWENKAEREEGLRKKAEKDAAEFEQKAAREESWRRLWEEKAVAEETLCKRYQQEAQTADGRRQHWQKKAEEQSSLLEEQGKALQQERELRITAEASASEGQSRAEHEENCRAKVEQDLEEWRRKAEAEETFRRECERKAEAEESLRKEWQEKALQREQDMELCIQQQFEKKVKAKDGELAEEVSVPEQLRLAKTQQAQDIPCMNSGSGPGRYCVTHTFQNMQATRDSGGFLWSPDLRFAVAEDMRLSYGFRLKFFPGGNESGERGAMSLYWFPLPGSDELLWPFPCDKAKIVLRILSNITHGAEGTKKRKMKEVVLDGDSSGFRHYVAKYTPPSAESAFGFGDHKLLTKAEFDQGGWISGPTATGDIVVQAELLFK